KVRRKYDSRIGTLVRSAKGTGSDGSRRCTVSRTAGHTASLAVGYCGNTECSTGSPDAKGDERAGGGAETSCRHCFGPRQGTCRESCQRCAVFVRIFTPSPNVFRNPFEGLFRFAHRTTQCDLSLI